MNNLTKSQVLALFLGLATAQDEMTLSDLLNKPTSADNVPADQTLLTASSASACAGNSECATDGEKCAQGQVGGFLDSGSWGSFCVNEMYCGFMGKLAGKPFFIACYEDVAEGETAVAPAAVDPAAYLTAMEEFITKPTYSWANFDDLIVSSRFAYQDGWFYLKEGKWTEYDKPADNRCFIDPQCGSDECCGYWPDQNNRRCMARTLDKVQQQAGPISFTPACSAPVDQNQAPENAQDDIAKGKLTEASDETDKFFNNEKNDKKTAAGYDDMTDEDKAEFDKKLEALDAKRAEFKDELKTLVGYEGEDFGDACKAIFEEEYLKYEKVRYEDCQKGEDGLYCAKADELMKTAFESMKGDGTADAKNYFCGENEMTDEDRQAWKDAYNTQREKDGAALVALSVNEGGPKEGEDGAECGEKGACPVGSCCGFSTASETQTMSAADVDAAVNAWIGKLSAPAADALADAADAGKIKNVCVNMGGKGQDMGTTHEWTPIFDVKLTHTCQAIAKLATSVAAAGAALYYM